MVPQETVIFAASARDNLRYSNWDATDEQLWDAARRKRRGISAQAPAGLDTFMGEGGARLSGGQRQRVSDHRALLRRAPLLLLDKATSALDAPIERLVQDALETLMRPHHEWLSRTGLPPSAPPPHHRHGRSRIVEEASAARSSLPAPLRPPCATAIRDNRRLTGRRPKDPRCSTT